MCTQPDRVSNKSNFKNIPCSISDEYMAFYPSFERQQNGPDIGTMEGSQRNGKEE